MSTTTTTLDARDSVGERSGRPDPPTVQETRQEFPSELRVIAVLTEAMARPRAIRGAPRTDPIGHVGGGLAGRLSLYHEAERVSQRETEERTGDGIGESGHGDADRHDAAIRPGVPAGLDRIAGLMDAARLARGTGSQSALAGALTFHCFELTPGQGI